MAAKKSHMKWSWIIIITFFLLGILDYRFGILGTICMGTPILQAIKGNGKVHCAKHCPRGSFLGKFMTYVSLNKPLPKFLRTRKAKNILLIIMGAIFTVSMIHTGFVFNKMAFAFLRFMGMSFIIGILMGVFFKPRSWCQVCPMGTAAGLIAEAEKKKRMPANKGGAVVEGI